MFIIDNYDVANVVSNTEKDTKLSVTQVQSNVRDIAMENILMDYEKELFQSDYGKVILPIDYNGKINYVEISFSVKKDDFNIENAIHDFEVRKQNTIGKELQDIEVKKMKQEIKSIRNK